MLRRKDCLADWIKDQRGIQSDPKDLRTHPIPMRLRFKNPFSNAYSLSELQVIRFLGAAPIFRSLDKRELHLLIQKKQERNYDKDEVIYFRNDPALALYMVKSGSISLLLDKGDDFEPFRIVNERETFGESCLLNDTRRMVNAISQSEKTELYIFPQEALFDFFDEAKKAREKMITALAQHQYETMYRIFRQYRHSKGFFDLAQALAN